MVKNNYDDVPYFSRVYPQTQPINIISTLKLFGIDAPILENARVLELGCGFGANIISAAINYDKTEFIGIDLSTTQIECGSELVDKIGLNNLKLYAMNILDVDDKIGKFDYIICHGILSWVDNNVKEKILQIFKNNLKEDGIGFVSYNCYPGWKQVEIIKDIMKFRNTNQQDIALTDKLRYGLGATDVIVEHGQYPKEFKEYASSLKNNEPTYLIHEFLEDVNDPFYFNDFYNLLSQNGLYYLSEANYYSIGVNISSDTFEIIKKETNNNFILNQQYIDFVTNKKFRNSLIMNTPIYEGMVSDEVKIADISKYHIRKKFGHNNNDEYKYIYDILDEAYPNSVCVADIISKFEKEKSTIYNDLCNLITFNFVDKYVEKIEFSDTISIKKEYLKFFELKLENENLPIEYANKYGLTFYINKEMYIGLKLLETPLTITQLKEHIKLLFDQNVFEYEGTKEQAIEAYFKELISIIYSCLITI